MPEDSNLHGHLSAVPKSHKFELSLNLTFKFMCCVSSMLVMVSDRWYSADFKIRRFLVSFPRARTLSRDVTAGASIV